MTLKLLKGVPRIDSQYISLKPLRFSSKSPLFSQPAIIWIFFMLHFTTLSVLTIQHRLYDYWSINRKRLGRKRSWPNRDNISASSWRCWWNKLLFQSGFESDISWTQGYSVNATPTCSVHTMSTAVTFASEERNGLQDISRTGLKGQHNRRHKLGSFEQRHRRMLSTNSM